MRNRIGLSPIGEVIDFEIIRDTKTKRFSVKIEEKKIAHVDRESKAVNKLLKGVSVGDIEKGDITHGQTTGVIVTDVQFDSPAWVGGLRAGDIITSVNKNDVSNLQEFLRAVDGSNRMLLLRVVRSNVAAFIIIK